MFWAKVLLISFLAVSLSGCISIFNSQEQVLTVKCSETDADIFINDVKYSNPAKVTLPRDKHVKVIVKKDGYTPYDTTITNSLSGCGVADAISAGFLLLPAFGLLTPGAYELTRTELSVSLYKAK